METAGLQSIAPDVSTRVVTAPYFVATKLEAFKGRGKGDLFGSRDLNDVIALVDGRESLAADIRSEPSDLRKYVGAEVRRLLAKPELLDALPGFLLPDAVSQSRLPIVVERLAQFAALR